MMNFIIQNCGSLYAFSVNSSLILGDKIGSVAEKCKSCSRAYLHEP